LTCTVPGSSGFGLAEAMAGVSIADITRDAVN